MDNGHQSGIFSQPETDGYVNEEDWQKSLQISAPVDMPSPEKLAKLEPQDPNLKFGSATQAQTEPQIVGPIGSEALTQPSLESLESPTETSLKEPTPKDVPSAFGQITPIGAPVAQKTEVPYNSTNIRTTGDHLEKSSIAEVDNAVSRLSQTGNLSDFYDEIRSMTETNLNNSFNRKLYDNGQGGSK